MLLRRYIVLPTILLALGVGNASAMTCYVNDYEGAWLRKNPDLNAEELCLIYRNGEFDSPERPYPPPAHGPVNFIPAKVAKDGEKIHCKPSVMPDRRDKLIHGYVPEFKYSHTYHKNQQISVCPDRPLP